MFSSSPLICSHRVTAVMDVWMAAKETHKGGSSSDSGRVRGGKVTSRHRRRVLYGARYTYIHNHDMGKTLELGMVEKDFPLAF